MHRLLAKGSRLGLAVVLLSFMTARTASADSVRIAWDPSPDPVSGYIVYVGAQSGTYTVIYDVGANLGFTYPYAAPGQPYYFAVASYNTPGPTIGTRSSEVVGYSNMPPTLMNPGDQVSAQGQPVSLQLVGSDPAGQTVSFSATGLPPGMQIAASGTISGAGTTVGAYSVTAAVSDGTLTASTTFPWTITAATVMPPTPISPSGTSSTAIPSFTWHPGANATSYRLIVHDSSGANPKIQRDYTPAQAGCAGSSTCTVSPGVVLAPGAASWQISVYNTSGNSASSTFTAFTVPSAVPPSDTTAPQIRIVAPVASGSYTASASPITIAGTASDNVGVSRVTWTVDRGGATVTGTAAGSTAWSASIPLTNGQNRVTITARDAAGNAVSSTITVQYKSGGSGKS
jgi:hypothetical protein